MNKPRDIYLFGPFRLEPAERRLWRDEQEIALRPKLFDLLEVFVRRAGQMLEKDELIQAVWADRSVEESNLTVSINALRRALDDERYIETVARRGYRFTAEVRPVQEAARGAEQGWSRLPAMDSPGGALPLQSPFYVERPTDREFCAAVARHDSIVLVKGPRQVGKTSLLARGLQHAREAGLAVVVTDFQHLTASAFDTVERLLLSLAELMVDQLDLPTAPHQMWNSFLSPSSNFERYVRREALAKINTPLVWGLDEADRIFNFEYASDFFGLIRSWHNLRALDPAGPWHRLTIALAYATEAHLFISDLNQSPFNVGTRLTLDDFTPEQIAGLNQRYGGPLRNSEELWQFYRLTGGHPYLTQRCLYEMVKGKMDIATADAHADRNEGIFGDHLSRLLVSLERDRALTAGLADFLRGSALSLPTFYRLRSAGVLRGDSPQEASPRCELYARYLRRCML